MFSHSLLHQSGTSMPGSDRINTNQLLYTIKPGCVTSRPVFPLTCLFISTGRSKATITAMCHFIICLNKEIWLTYLTQLLVSHRDQQLRCYFTTWTFFCFFYHSRVSSKLTIWYLTLWLLKYSLWVSGMSKRKNGLKTNTDLKIYISF